MTRLRLRYPLLDLKFLTWALQLGFGFPGIKLILVTISYLLPILTFKFNKLKKVFGVMPLTSIITSRCSRGTDICLLC